MYKCWVKECEEDPFIELEEIWFDLGEDGPPIKICSSKTMFKDSSRPWFCQLHYMSYANKIATGVLEDAYLKGLLGPLIPTRWFVLYRNPSYQVDGDVCLVRDTKEIL